MDFGKYIHELLLENEIVILPGFGAFVSEYKPAEISEDSDEMKPPSKIVSFNQQIRNNDGLLVGLVAEKKRISHFEALKRIEKERENILYKLDIGEQVDLEDVGLLYYNDEHNIEFKAEQDENLLLDSFGLEATTISVPSEEIEEEQALETPIIESEIIEEQAEEQITVVPEIIEEPTPLTQPELQKEETTEEKKKKGWWWLLLILIPLIAVSVFIFMKGRENVVVDEQKESAITIIEKPAVIPQDTVISDTATIAKKDTLKAEIIESDSIVEIDENAPKYYLVGGSFSVEENAETYLHELKSKGFDAFHVGKKGRFFIVGIGTYNTFDEAEKAKKEYMTNNTGSEVWVWKK